MLPPDGATIAAPIHHRLAWWWLAILVTGAAAAALLVDGVRERGDLSAYDPRLTADVIGHRTPILTRLADVWTFVGGTVSLTAMTLAMVAWAAWRRRNGRLALLAAGAVVTSTTLTVVIKRLVGRTRPPATWVLGGVDPSFAFPSGHTLNSTVCFGLIAGLIYAAARQPSARALAVAGWLAATAAVAASRVYLGAHWATDVAGGFTIGVAVLAAAVLVAVWARLPLWTRPAEARRAS